MRPLGSRKSHYWKLQKMLRATGTDAASAFEDGELSPQDWANMVESCRGCAWVGGCKHFLDQALLEGHHDDAPKQCRNRKALEALRQTHPEVA